MASRTPTPTTPARNASTPKRDLLLDCANRLFNKDGYHAVGIDTILADAGLAKMTLYHHFRSKEELIVAALERRSEGIGASIRATLEAAGASPRKRLLALFGWYEEWFKSEDFHGCVLLRAAGEYPELNSPVHQAVIRSKKAGRDRIEGLLSEMGVPGAATLAIQIDLLIQGAISLAHTHGDPSHLGHAREAALTLIKAAGAK